MTGEPKLSFQQFRCQSTSGTSATPGPWTSCRCQRRTVSGVTIVATEHSLLAHLVARFEVALRAGDDLSVGRMIRRLDADDLRLEATFVLVHVLEEFELR